MNKCAIEHIVDSAYCFPISSNEIVLRLRTAKDDLVSAKVFYESKYVIGESHKEALMTKTYVGEIFDYYEVTLRLTDTRLAYVFYVDDGMEEYYFSEDGLTKDYDFTIGFYNFFQYPYINEADITKCVPWMKEAVFYQIFVDRFNMADEDKDKSYINMKWMDTPTPKSFAGGDLKGITKKLDYIKSLGCNAIYLTPIFKSISNHKYDISDYYQVDEQFGTNLDLKKLVDMAHQKGMRILLDAVFNHCSENIKQFQDVLNKGKESKYFDWFVINGDKISENKDNYETFASCEYMPKLNTSNIDVQEFLLEIGEHYIKEYDIDGWRLDVSDEISHSFWRKFRERIKACKEEAVIIGENWHDANNYLRGDQYDSIMNYAFTKLCLDYFATGTKNAEQAAWKLNELLMRNTSPVNDMMLNLLDSHDTHRFFKEVKKDRFKMKAALALLFMYTGAPCIFYGTETLTYGGYDPDCRRCMDWENAKADGCYADIYKLILKLSKLRTDEKLADGKLRVYSEGELLILENVLSYEKANEEMADKRVVRLIINNTNKRQNISLENNKGVAIVNANSFYITLNERMIIHG